MSCTPSILSNAFLSTGNTCASQGLQDATFDQCVALRGTFGYGAPFWHNEADLTSTVSIPDYPTGCFYSDGGGGNRRLYWNTHAGSSSNDYRTYDACGCAEFDCSACGGGNAGNIQGCEGGVGVYSSAANGCVNPGGTHYCRDPATGNSPTSVCNPAPSPPPTPPPPPPPETMASACPSNAQACEWRLGAFGANCDDTCALADNRYYDPMTAGSAECLNAINDGLSSPAPCTVMVEEPNPVSYTHLTLPTKA